MFTRITEGGGQCSPLHLSLTPIPQFSSFSYCSFWVNPLVMESIHGDFVLGRSLYEKSWFRGVAVSAAAGPHVCI